MKGLFFIINVQYVFRKLVFLSKESRLLIEKSCEVTYKMKTLISVAEFFVTNAVGSEGVSYSWCSGYHICLTRRRSQVRDLASTKCGFLFTHYKH